MCFSLLYLIEDGTKKRQLISLHLGKTGIGKCKLQQTRRTAFNDN